MRAFLESVTFVVLALIVAGCNSGGGDKEKVYDIKGTVVSLNAEKKTVRLDHEDIPGFMKAMEMDFPVQDSKLLTSLKVGDQVQGRLKAKDSNYVITELQKR